MDLTTWIAFVVAACLLLAIPGPTILLVISYAISGGRKSAWATVPGVALGDFTAMSASLLGLGAILSASSSAFMVIKWIGAAYLIYLGWRAWVTRPEKRATVEPRRSHTIMAHTFLVTALNPKSIVFYVAFLPQFLQPDLPLTPQLLLLGGTFLILATLNATVYALLAAQVQTHIKSPRAQIFLNRLSGGILMSAGVLLGTMKRTT